MHTLSRDQQRCPAPSSAAERSLPRARPLGPELTPARAEPQPSPKPTSRPRPVIPPIPPQPLPPRPYDCDAEGLTMCDLLRECLGCYIVSEHLVGLSEMETREGRLVRVEASAFVLEEPETGDPIVCDYFSLKFFRCLARPPQV